jgi:hypothetical protein
MNVLPNEVTEVITGSGARQPRSLRCHLIEPVLDQLAPGTVAATSNTILRRPRRSGAYWSSTHLVSSLGSMGAEGPELDLGVSDGFGTSRARNMTTLVTSIHSRSPSSPRKKNTPNSPPPSARLKMLNSDKKATASTAAAQPSHRGSARLGIPDNAVPPRSSMSRGATAEYSGMASWKSARIASCSWPREAA